MRWRPDDSSLAKPSSDDELKPRQTERRAAERLLAHQAQGYNVRLLPLLGVIAAALIGGWIAIQALRRDDSPEPRPAAASATPDAAPSRRIWIELE